MIRLISRLLPLCSLYASFFAALPVSAQTELPDSTFLKTAVRKFNDSLTNRIGLEKDTLARMLRAGDYLQAANLGEKLSEQLDLVDRNVQSKVILDSVIAYYKKVQSQRLQGVYSQLGVYYYNNDDYEKAVEYGLLAVKTGEALRDSSVTMCKVYSDIALTYNTMADFERAEKYAAKGAAIARIKHYISPLYLLVSNIAYSLSNTKRYDEAIALLDRTAAEYPSTNHTDHLYLLGRYVVVFLDKGRPDEARPYALSLIRMGKGPLDCICEYTHWFFTICRYYRANKEFDKLRKFIAVCHPQNTLSTIQHIGILSHKFRADSALGQYREAMISR